MCCANLHPELRNRIKPKIKEIFKCSGQIAGYETLIAQRWFTQM